MSDWQVGDLAVCVDASSCNGLGSDAPFLLTEGRIYRVRAVTPGGRVWRGDWRGVGLILVGVERSGNPDFAASRFRKIRPDEHEACEEEFVTLLKRVKRTVSA